MKKFKSFLFYLVFGFLSLVGSVAIVFIIVDMFERRYPLVNVPDLIFTSLILAGFVTLIRWYKKRDRKILKKATIFLVVGFVLIPISSIPTVKKTILELHSNYEAPSTQSLMRSEANRDDSSPKPLPIESEDKDEGEVIYERKISFGDENEVIFLVREELNKLKGLAVVAFDGKDPIRESALIDTLGMFFLLNDYKSFSILLVTPEGGGMLSVYDGENRTIPDLQLPQTHREAGKDYKNIVAYKDDCLYLLSEIADFESVPSFIEEFQSFVKSTEWDNRPQIRTPIYDDELVEVSFVGFERSSLNQDKLIFEVKNKTNVTLTFQGGPFAIDGRDLGFVTGSDKIAAQSIGKVGFRFGEELSSLKPASITGTIKVIDFDKIVLSSSVEISFVNESVKYE